MTQFNTSQATVSQDGCDTSSSQINQVNVSLASVHHASSIGDYLCYRREQTQTAYQRWLQPTAASASTAEIEPEPVLNQHQHGQIFQALFTSLWYQLQAGHTIIELSQHWQQQLLEYLLLPLYPFLLSDRDGDGNKDNAQDNQDGMDAMDVMASLLASSTLQTQLAGLDEWVHTRLQQPTLSKFERQLLLDKWRQIRQLQALWQQHHINSLSKFIQQLTHNAWLQNSRHHAEQHHPQSVIVYSICSNTSTSTSTSNNNSNNNSNNDSNNPANNNFDSFDDSHLLDHPSSNPNSHTSNHNQHNGTEQRVTLWLHRIWYAERDLCQHIQRLLSHQVQPLPLQLSDKLNDEQRHAIEIANHNAFSLITGGPGTGKTFTVAQLVMALAGSPDSISNTDQSDNSSVLALAAPTGKAAQRMQESLQAALTQAGMRMQLPDAKTIHRLLGIGRDGVPRYHESNPLPEDIIIIDEASMLGVELSHYLLRAIKSGARLILLGDANQLAAVDAGAVLADLCAIKALQPYHQRLHISRRFDAGSGIGRLAAFINTATELSAAADADIRGIQDKQSSSQPSPAQAHNQLRALLATLDNISYQQLAGREGLEGLPDTADVTAVGIDAGIAAGATTHSDIHQHSPSINSLSKYQLYEQLKTNYRPFIDQSIQQLKNPAEQLSNPVILAQQLMAVLNQFRILSAGHHGYCGDHQINQMLSEHHQHRLTSVLGSRQAVSKLTLQSGWYHGRPVMVLKNNYQLGLYNGDIGVCLQNQMGKLEVFFEGQRHGIAIDALNAADISTAYAMTIHKSQGSEFEHVAIVFDDSNQRLLSKELIYTAVTRAKQQVSIYSTDTALLTAIHTPTQRMTGLGQQFADR